MKMQWKMWLVVVSLSGLLLVPSSFSQDEDKELFQNHLVLSLFLGAGLPSGDFSSDTLGNHESGGDASLEIEWYFAKQVSVGLAVSAGVFDDKDPVVDIQTTVSTVGAFIKYTLASSGKWHPYGKFGVGRTELEFEFPAFTLETESGTAIMLAAGVLGRVSDLISINGQFAYNKSSLEDAEIKGLPNTIVGFDVEYFAIDIGISFYFRI